MTESLCKTCLNQETAFVFNGARYAEQPICVYDMVKFPKTYTCEKYEPVEEVSE